MSQEIDIEARLEEQKKRLHNAAEQCGRNPTSVQLIAVSKRHSSNLIRRAYAAGQRDFGENYVQELVLKARELCDLTEIRWHMIGHLQSNKCGLVAGLVDCVHTVDSVKLAHTMGRKVSELQEGGSAVRPLRVLVEVKLSDESTKHGCTPQLLPEVLRAIDEQDSLCASGLMTMPPAAKDPQEASFYFQKLAQLRASWGGKARLPELSMGMSHDAEVAVAAGATLVRIGSAIFGPRPVH